MEYFIRMLEFFQVEEIKEWRIIQPLITDFFSNGRFGDIELDLETLISSRITVKL